jgi:hypothetical protein
MHAHKSTVKKKMARARAGKKLKNLWFSNRFHVDILKIDFPPGLTSSRSHVNGTLSFLHTILFVQFLYQRKRNAPKLIITFVIPH